MSIAPLFHENEGADTWGWGSPSPFYRRQISGLRDATEELARGLTVTESTAVFGGLVHAAENALLPIHRWYGYKEAFSPRLPQEVLARYGAGVSGRVGDVFAGVATTQLALLNDPRVREVIGVEYSPFAHFAGVTKLRAFDLDPLRVDAAVAAALRYRSGRDLPRPGLSSFEDARIFAPEVLDGLLSAKRHILGLDLPQGERDFLLLGLAAAAEHLSGVIKDGRALRVAGNGHRKRPQLLPRQRAPESGDVVRHALASQWAAMAEDLVGLDRRDEGPAAGHLRGDARDLGQMVLEDGRPAFADGSIGLFVASPPYLNCIDYSEVYKLELWLLDFVRSQEAFRDLRLGTIRSHPSVQFPSRPYLEDIAHTEVAKTVSAIGSFLQGAHARGAIGRVAEHYFADMAQVLREQFRVLEPGGHAVLVVGNSLFSRRDRTSAANAEAWRLPVLTDVILARLAEAVGFIEPEILVARALRARNVTAGASRESLVVVRKPTAVLAS